MCNYCEKIISSGVSRMKHHLACTRQNTAACEKVPDDVAQLFLQILGDLKKKKSFYKMMRMWIALVRRKFWYLKEEVWINL